MTPEPTVVIAKLEPHWLAAADACLSPDEETRAVRFPNPVHRDTWRAGRAWVRHQLSTLLRRPPATLAFHLDSRGRPHVVDVPPGFDCNWSHSGPWMALAASPREAVGIDVEVVRSDFPFEEVAPSVCTTSERALLAAMPDAAARRRLFFRLWTAKEALMKATGLGAALDPAGIEVDVRNGLAQGYRSHPGWQLATCDPHPECTAAWAHGQPPSRRHAESNRPDSLGSA